MSSLFVFTGENEFELLQERTRWIDEFRRKHGTDNCLLIHEPLSVRELLDEVAVQPFLSEKRLVICDEVPRASAEEIEALEQSIHPQVVLVFATTTLDKRTSAAKALLKRATVRTFEPLKGADFTAWVRTYSAQCGLSVDAQAVRRLVELIGSDQMMMAREIERLALQANGAPLSADEVEQSTIPAEEGVVWRLSDLLVAGKHTQAFQYAHTLMERGTDPHGLWALLLSFMRNIVGLCAAYDAGITDQKALAQEVGVHPFAVRNQMPLIRSIDRKHLHAFALWAAEKEVELKTGQLRSADDAPEELIAVVDRFLLTFGKSVDLVE